MDRYLYSVEKVAHLLEVHQKTVLRYIREGKLKANKVGGRWKIHGNDLSSFVGSGDFGRIESMPEKRPKPKKQAGVNPEARVSTVVHGENIDHDDAVRISNTMIALMNSKSEQDGKGRLDTVYFEEDLKIQVLIWGNIDFTQKMLMSLKEVLK